MGVGAVMAGDWGASIRATEPRWPTPSRGVDPSSGGPPRSGRSRSGVSRVARFIVAVVVLAGVAMGLFVDNSMRRVGALADYPGRPPAGSGTNWLIVGSDSRQGLTPEQTQQLHTGDARDVEGARTDTIMVLHLPSSSTKPTMISLFRDSAVSIPGHGRAKINVAFEIGGAPLLVRTVEQASGLRIDHYAEVGFGGFAGVVDDVGGVSMCLPAPVRDFYAGIDLPAGCQNLRGADALGYVRSRHAFASSDFARTQHQRQFLGALAAKIANPAVLLNPFRVIPLVLDLPQALTVARSDHLPALISMTWAVRGIGSGGVITTAVPVSGSSGGDLLWNRVRAQALFRALNHDQPSCHCSKSAALLSEVECGGACQSPTWR